MADPTEFQAPEQTERSKYLTNALTPPPKPLTPTPTTNDPVSRDRSTDVAARTMEVLGTDVNMATALSRLPSALMTIPEISAAVGDPNTASALAVALYSDGMGEGQYKIDDDTSNFIRRALGDHNNYGSELVNEMVLQSLPLLGEVSAGLFSPERQDKLLSESLAWLRQNPDVATNQETLEKYVWFHSDLLRGLQQDMFSRTSLLGKLGSIVETPFRAVTSLMVEAQVSGSVALGNMQPQDAYYRRMLSPGQNMVLAHGWDMDSQGYQMASGAADFILNGVADPLAWTGNFANGRRLARVNGIMNDMSSFRKWATALTPIYGARKGKLIPGRKVRFMWTRIGYVSNAKITEDLLTSPKLMEAYSLLAKVSDRFMIAEMMPSLAKSDKLINFIADTSDPKIIQRAVQDAFMGAFTDTSPVYKVLDDAASAANGTLRKVMRDEVSGGTPQVKARPDDLARALGSEAVEEIDEAARSSAITSGNIYMDDLNLRTNPARLRSFSDEIEDGIWIWDDSVRPNVGDVGIDPDDIDPIALVLWRETSDGSIESIGSLIGSPTHGFNIGVDAAYEGRGFGREMMRRSGQTTEELTSGGGAISGKGARALNRAAAQDSVSLRAASGAAGWSDSRGVWTIDAETGRLIPDEWNANGARKLIFDDNAKIVNLDDPAQATKFQKWVLETQPTTKDWDDVAFMYGEAIGADAVLYGDEGGIVLNSRMILEGYDNTNEISKTIMAAYAKRQTTRASFSEYRNADTTRGWVIKDMPSGKHVVDIDVTPKLKPPRFSGASNSRSYWLRAAKGRVFSEAPEAKIDIYDVAAGTRQLKKLFYYFGVKYDDVVELVGRYANSNVEDRFATIIEIVQEAGEKIDQPFLRYNITEFFDRQGIRGFALGADNEEILRTASRSTPGAMSARPIIPAMLTDSVDVPDPVQLMHSLKRYRMAKSAVPTWNGGIFKGTRDRRIDIGHKIKAKLGKQADDMSPEEIAAMAYASVGDVMGYGPGVAATLGQSVHGAWRFMTASFSVMQLAFRPIPWFTRVYLDEAFRGSMAELPSIFSNPVRYLSGIWDGRAVTKANARKAYMLKRADAVMAGFKGLDSTGEVLAHGEEVIPDLKAVIAAEYSVEQLIENPLSVGRLKAIISDLVEQAVLKNDFSEVNVGVSVYRRRGWQHSIRITRELGVDITKRGQEFSWSDDVTEIANAAWAQTAGLSAQNVPVTFRPGQNTGRNVKLVAVAAQNNIQLLAKDQFGRAALVMMSRKALGQTTTGMGSKISMTAGWQHLRPWIVQWADEAGYVGLSDAQLAERYLDEVVGAWARNLLTPLMPEDPGDQARILQSIANGDLVEMHGLKFNFRNNSDGVEAMEALLYQLDERGIDMPPQWMHVAPHRFMDEPDVTFANRVKNVPGTIIRFMGDEMSQKLNRRGAYLHAMRREKATRMALGMSEEAATHVARMKAADIVNNVYYNMESVTPFLRSMNQVSPFFTATWEIAQTWAYKIPMMQGGAGVGHARMIRKIDRTIGALAELGLIEYDEDGGARLVLDTEADTGNFLGDEISKRAALLLRQPLTVAAHLLNLGHGLFSSEQLALDEMVPSKFSIAASTPIDVQNYGVGSALDNSLSLHPMGQWATSSIRSKIPAIADIQYNPGVGSLLDTAQEYDVDPGRLIAYNADVLRTHLGPAKYNELRFGDLELSDVDVTGLDLKMPNTGLWATWVSDTFFPFGDVDNISEVAQGFTPQWMKYAFRAAGLWENGEELEGFMGVNLSPANEAAMNGAILSGMRHLEATEGVLTRRRELRDDFTDLALPYLETGSLVWSDDGSNILWKGVKPENAEVVEMAFQNMMDHQEYVLDRAINLGASTTMLRAILAAILPGTPQLFYEEEKHLDSYYEAYDRAAFGRGDTDSIPVARRSNMMEVIAMVNEWIVDPSGRSTARLFLENHPDMAPFLTGKTFWENNGQPPLETTLTTYFQDIEDGLRKPVPVGVWLHRQDISAVETSRDVAFIQKYGMDPYQATANALFDPEGMVELQEEFNTKRDILDWEDDMNGGDYAAHKDRGTVDNFDVIAAQLQQYSETVVAVNDVIDLVEASPNMSPGQIKELAGQLKGLKQGIRDIVEELDSSEDDFSWMSPHRQLYMRYFDEVYVPFLDAIGGFYDELETAHTSEARDIIWGKVAAATDQWNEKVYMFSERPDVALPSPPEYQWENKAPMYKDHTIAQGIIGKIEWIDLAKAQRIIEANPQLVDYIPNTPAQRSLINNINDLYVDLDATYANGTGPITYKTYMGVKKVIAETMQTAFIENGWTQMAMWNVLWPVQRLDLAGQIPPSFERYGLVDMVAMIQAQALSEGHKSVGEDNPARNALNRQIVSWMDTDSQFKQDILDLGFRLYDTRMLDKLIPILFFNENPIFAG